MAQKNIALDPKLLEHMRKVANHLRTQDVPPSHARDVLREYLTDQMENSDTEQASSAGKTK